jgi:hypothetical protein
MAPINRAPIRSTDCDSKGTSNVSALAPRILIALIPLGFPAVLCKYLK